MAEALMDLGEKVRDAVRSALASRSPRERTQIHGHAASDVIYRIDLDAEKIIIDFLRQEARRLGGVVLVAEGIAEGNTNVFPEELDPPKAAWRLLCDPIDGTRALMVGKRSAFFLAGAAPNRGADTRLSEVQAAVMVEIPTERAFLSDVLWAVIGEGAHGFTRNLLDGSRKDQLVSPSPEPSFQGGFAQISRFFHPGKEVLAEMEEELVRELFPDLKDGEIAAFEDQYVCSGGQLYELLMGKDRFTADLRHSLYSRFRREGRRVGHECHPYDLAAILLGREAGLFLTDVQGRPLDAPLDTESGLDWIGYANADIRNQVAPVLARLVKKHLS